MAYETDLVRAAFGPEGLLAKKFPGYIERPQQVELARAVQEAIKERKLLFGEAPTGVGKSLGTLIPSAEVIFNQSAPVVVVTSSIVLQEQYFHKDVPLLEDILGRSLNATLIKGRNNYLCVHKARSVKSEKSIATSPQHQEHRDLLQWAARTKTGDMSELEFVPKPQVWADFAAVEDNECHGKQCPMYGECHYYRERKKVLSSKLIICNYHYFLNAMKNEKMLPPEVRVVIMDEGHEISAIARDFQEQRYTVYTLRNLMNAFLKTGRALEHEDFQIGAEFQAFVVDAEVNRLQGSIENMFVQLAIHYRTYKPKEVDNWTMNRAQRADMQQLAQSHFDCLEFTLAKTMTAITSLYEDKEYEEMLDTEQRWVTALEKLYDGLKGKQAFMEAFFGLEAKVSAALRLLGEQEHEDPRPLPPEDETIIHWMQPTSDSNGVTLHIKPSLAAPLMSEVLDPENHTFTPIIVSATLAVNGSFDYVAHELGVGPDYKSLIVSSPFNLTEKLLWYLPANMPAGNDPRHFDAATAEMIKVIEVLEGRTLCLFTSVKSLQNATQLFRRVLPKHIEVIAQNELPRPKLVAKMKANPHTVLVGTRSFFTGIDIPGPNLSAVLIDKLPYPMIGDPVNDYLMSRPRGFHTFTLPETIVALKQGFGRGNRTADDHCLVGVFDGRLATGSYKFIIFNSFDFKVTATRDWQQVETYLRTIPK